MLHADPDCEHEFNLQSFKSSGFQVLGSRRGFMEFISLRFMVLQFMCGVCQRGGSGLSFWGYYGVHSKEGFRA